MALLRDEDREYLKKEFEKKIRNPVKVLFFEKEGCENCDLVKQILTEVSELHPEIHLSIQDVESDEAKTHGIELTPAVVIEGEKDYGIRFYGVPAGYEFNSLIEGIMDVGAGEVELSEETRKKLGELDKPVVIKVFVTTGCPYCPGAVRLAHMFAFVNDKIKGEMIEPNSFPELANRYGVYAVPKVIINEEHSFEGSLPESEFLKEVIKAVGG